MDSVHVGAHALQRRITETPILPKQLQWEKTERKKTRSGFPSSRNLRKKKKKKKK